MYSSLLCLVDKGELFMEAAELNTVHDSQYKICLNFSEGSFFVQKLCQWNHIKQP